MDIQVGPESSISTPPAGYRTLFINTDKNNVLYYKLPDGTFEPFTGDSDGSIDEIALAWTKALTCALDSGIITATEFNTAINQGITVNKTTSTDATTGTTSSTVTVGARNILLVSITLDSATFTGAVGATRQIVTTFDPTNVSDKGLTYVSSNLTKATVSATGLITNVASGSAIISVIPNADPSKAKIVTVTVS